MTSAHLEEERGRDLHFLLPLHQSRPAVLSQLFAQLELQKEALGVTSYGLSACSMEEVCLKLINVCRLLSSTVELLLKGTPEIRAPLYKRHFAVSQILSIYLPMK